MSAQALQQLEGLVAELSLWAADDQPPQLAALGLRLRTLSGLLTARPALKVWLDTLARWASERAAKPWSLDAAETLIDVALASVEWAQGRDPAEVGAGAGIHAVMDDLAVPHAMRERLRARLNAEARAALAAVANANVEPQHADNLPAVAPASGAEAHVLGGGIDAAEALLGEPNGDSSTALQTSAGDAAATAIFLSVEERDLLVEAVYSEVIPELSLWLAAPQPLSTLPRLSFLLEAQRRTLEVIGLAAAAEAVALSERAIEAVDESAADPLAQWFVGFSEWLRDPTDGASQALLSSTNHGLAACLGRAELAGMLDAEQLRLQIGIDPALRAARRTRSVEADDLSLKPSSDVLPQVLRGMLGELPRNVANLSRSIGVLQRGRDAAALEEAKRVAHTIKGDANTVGIKGLANITHALEDIFVALDQDHTQWSPELLAFTQEGADMVGLMADCVLGRGPEPTDAEALLLRLNAVSDAIEDGSTLPLDQRVSTRHEAPPAAAMAESAAAVAVAAPVPSAAPVASSEDMLTVPRSILDRLLRLSSEALALGNQIKGALQAAEEQRHAALGELATLRAVIAQVDEQVGLRGADLAEKRRRQGALDALELDQYSELYVLSRRLHESWSDMQFQVQHWTRADEQVVALTTRRGGIDDELQAAIRHSRLVPISDNRARFERAVRQAARALTKPVDVRLEGDDLQIDKLTLDALVVPLMHLLRNAVDHGIEDPEVRAQRRKAEAGLIHLSFAVRAQYLEVVVADDGGGIDFERVRAKALRLGISGADQLSSQALTELLLRPGFSTRDDVTQISGRGVGLDVVARSIQGLGGTLRIDSERGAGTSFRIRVPLTLGVMHIATVAVGEHTYGLAIDSFDRFDQLLAGESLRQQDRQFEAQVGDQWWPVTDLGLMLGQPPVALGREAPIAAVLVQERAVVLIPPVASLSLAVLEPLSTLLPPIRGVRGVSVLSDGRAAPVIGLRELWLAQGTPNIDLSLFATRQSLPLVVVADDSLTIRQGLGDLLVDAGYAVALARDGLEALMVCHRQTPVALLVDLEMPRMNGLELSAALRKDPRFAELPIIMITSRTQQRHHDLAIEAGVDQVLGKPYSDEDVLRVLNEALAGRL